MSPSKMVTFVFFHIGHVLYWLCMTMLIFLRCKEELHWFLSVSNVPFWFSGVVENHSLK